MARKPIQDFDAYRAELEQLSRELRKPRKE